MREDFLILDIEKEPVEILEYERNSNESLLKVAIEENEKIVDLEGYQAIIYFKLPNEKILEFPCDIINNEVNINLNNTILANEGRVYYEIKLENNFQRVTTFTTYLKIN